MKSFCFALCFAALLLVIPGSGKPKGVTPRTPRVVMLSTKWCPPCRKAKRELGWLMGNASKPIQVIDIGDEAERLAEVKEQYGLHDVGGVPYFFVVGKDGKWNKAAPMRGYVDKDLLLNYLKKHKVSTKHPKLRVTE